MITITVEGPDKAGKGNLMALIHNFLVSKNIQVQLQGAESHLAEKLERSETQLVDRLLTTGVNIIEQQTFR